MADGQDNVAMEENQEPEKEEPKSGVPTLEKTESQTMAAIDRGEPDGQVDKEEDFQFSDSLEGFKLAFNEKGQLRNMDSGEPFVFKVKDDHQYNQKRYEHLGEIITNHVFELLEKDGKLKRVYLPEEATDGEERSFVFQSDDALTNPDKLMVLIHGSGVVRAGQWARRLIINDCLDSGTQLPYIKRAAAEGYGVLVLNTNLNSDKEDNPIRENENPEAHALCAWDQILSKAAAKHILIVAHSYGGIVTTDLAISRTEDFMRRVVAIAFTDSVHSLAMQEAPADLCNFFEKNARNWVSSDEPLDTAIMLPGSGSDAPCVSAGHPKHEWTSWAAFESVFKFFEEKLARKVVKSEL